jgi:hypothetical protein
VSYLVAAFFPTCLFAPRCPAISFLPEWVGRTSYFTDALTFGAIFYGIHKRISVFWKLIPALVLIFLLKMAGFVLWYLIWRSLPWIPFIAIITVLLLIGLLILMPWWRQQDIYFEDRSTV